MRLYSHSLSIWHAWACLFRTPQWLIRPSLHSLQGLAWDFYLWTSVSSEAFIMDSALLPMTLLAQMKKNKQYPIRLCIASCLQQLHSFHQTLYCFKVLWQLLLLLTGSQPWWSLSLLLWGLIRVVSRKNLLLFGLRNIDKIVLLLI